MIKNKTELLRQIADSVCKLGKMRIESIKVTFVTDTATYEFSLGIALECLAEDTYWDERGNWEDAHTALVDVF